MIASVLKLSRADCQNLKFKDAYSLHKFVYSLFPRQTDETRDFLFADKGSDSTSRQILILSRRKPETQAYGISSKEISSSFLNYECYRFEVIMNPTTRNGPSKKTTPIRGIDNLHKWFIQKAPSYGFELEPDSLQVRGVGVVCFDKTKENTRYSHTYGTATFIGTLKVIDRKLFIKNFQQGIGRAKGFGFGLLQLVPIK